METLSVISKLLAMGWILGALLIGVLFGPETVRFIRDKFRASNAGERFYWFRRRMAKRFGAWWNKRADDLLGYLIVIVAFGLVWVGFVIATPQ